MKKHPQGHTDPVTPGIPAGPRGADRGLRLWLRRLASPRIFCYTLLWLIILLFIGSIAQKYIGLHEAQVRYFSSWFMRAGPVPLPGGRLTMTVVFVNLLAVLLTSPYHWRRFGVIISHLGALLLLVGGFITAYQSIEGRMLIPEGEQRGYFEDDYDLELAVIDSRPSDFDEVTAFSGGLLKVGATMELEHFDAEITVEELHQHCRLEARKAEAPADAHGVAVTSELRIQTDVTAEEFRSAGAVLRLSGIGEKVDGIYFALEDYSPTTVSDTAGNPIFELSLRSRRYRLPFAVVLDDFEVSKHPGTEMARDYRSHVSVIRENSIRRAEIWMNHPLRTGGYTFYQSSYIDGRTQATILSVVRNAGRLFPYISSIIICVGMMIHLAILFLGKSTRRRQEGEGRIP